MNNLVVSLLLVIGALFGLLGAVGVVRMPDLFTRLQASTKAGTLGVFFLMIAAAVHFGEMNATVRALLVIAFLFLTAPVAAHVISRAAYSVSIPLWERTAVDELSKAREADPAAADAGEQPIPSEDD